MIYLINKYLLSYYYIPGSLGFGIFSFWNKWMNKQVNILSLMEPVFSEEWQQKNKYVECQMISTIKKDKCVRQLELLGWGVCIAIMCRMVKKVLIEEGTQNAEILR